MDDSTGAPGTAEQIQAPAAPPPPAEAPQWVPPAAPPPEGWVPPASQVPPSRRRRNVLVGIVVGVIVLVGIAAATGSLKFTASIGAQRGVVVFGTAAGTDLCTVGKRSDTIKVGEPVYFGSLFVHKLDGKETIRLTVTRDGTPMLTHDETGTGEAFDCYGSREALGTLDSGTYVFTVTHKGEVEATGTLTVS